MLRRRAAIGRFVGIGVVGVFSVSGATAGVPEPRPTPTAKPTKAPAPNTGPCAVGDEPLPELAVAPPRERGALTGGAFAGILTNLEPQARQPRMVAELLKGNLPPSLRHLCPVRWEGLDARGVAHTVEVYVTADYVSVGSDADALRVPLDLPAALSLAGAWDMALPTTRLVDEIYRAANLRVKPSPIPPDSRMASPERLIQHRSLIHERGLTDGRTGELRAGMKKDLVVTTRLAHDLHKVAIYGWHRDEGKPIQPLSLWHGERYYDYSHGVRLVSRDARVDGQPVDWIDLLQDPVLATLVSNEGPIPKAWDLLRPGEDVRTN